VAKFVDRTGTEWHLSIDYGLIKKCRTAAGVDLGKILSDLPKLGSFLESPDELIATFLILCGEQIIAAKLSQDDFESRFDGPTLEAARVALVEAIANFTRPPKIATAIAASLKKVTEANNELAEKRLTVATEEAVRTLSGSAMNSPASAA
jgi:hypothetical protein